ncbi:hypothetical protein R1sor_024520 [Riccia sorocarpa]|uniref:Prolyl endopeptidase n=1 Tax=Riccia sorocarpa TaxID=122646 RepID=A0ABD3GUR2_9MARC
MVQKRVMFSMFLEKATRGISRFWSGFPYVRCCRAVTTRLVHTNDSPVEDFKNRRDCDPPNAPKRPFKRTKHGITWWDPYHWMRVKREKAIRYLQLENAYAEKSMVDTLPLQRKLEKEMASRLTQETSTPPERIGPWLYYTRVPKGQEYNVYYRRRHTSGAKRSESMWKRLASSILGWDDPDGEEELLDMNGLAEQFGYVQLGTCRLSKDQNLMAYTLDTSGNEIFSLFVKDLQTGNLIVEEREISVGSVEWAGNGRTLYYTEVDDLLRPWRVYRRTLGSASTGTLLFEEKDASSFLHVSRTKDWTFVTVNANSKTTSEVYLVDADDPYADLQLVEKRTPGVQYFLEHHEGFLYILTNRQSAIDADSAMAGDYRLVRCNIEDLGRQDWEEVVSVEQGALIEDMEIFQNHLVLYQLSHGLPRVEVLDLPLTGIQSRRRLRLPQKICTVIPGANEDFTSSVFRLTVSSPNLPETILEYDLATGKAEVLQQEAVLGVKGLRQNQRRKKLDGRESSVVTDHDVAVLSKDLPVDPDNLQLDFFSQYICERHEVNTSGGVSVPLTVVHKSRVHNGKDPALLIGYGAYGKNLAVEWCSDHLSLLDRGWVVAFAHVRGGGELGRTWYQAGQRLKKKNSFNDFIACANFLVDNKLAHKHKLSALGVSAGGLLVASVMNLNPSLFKAVILQAPFLDISNSLLDKDLPLSVHEYDEWGDPDDPHNFANIRSYSPYDNVREGEAYPAVLVKCGLLDKRVGYWEAAKYVATIRDVTAGDQLVLLKCSMDTGHVQDCGRFSHLGDTAYDYAFLLRTVGS